jgi:hypothetical protein
LAHARRQSGLGQQPVDRIREGRGTVRDNEVALGGGLDPLSAERSRDDGLSHCHSLDDFKAGAAAAAAAGRQ